MKKEKFEALCKDVLGPLVAEIVHMELRDVNDMLEMMAAELAHIERKVEDLQLGEVDNE